MCSWCTLQPVCCCCRTRTHTNINRRAQKSFSCVGAWVAVKILCFVIFLRFALSSFVRRSCHHSMRGPTPLERVLFLFFEIHFSLRSSLIPFRFSRSLYLSSVQLRLYWVALLSFRFILSYRISVSFFCGFLMFGIWSYVGMYSSREWCQCSCRFFSLLGHYLQQVVVVALLHQLETDLQ